MVQILVWVTGKLNRDEELLKYAEVVDGPINILSGTPSNDDVGDHTVTLEISDGDGGTSERQFQ